MRRSLRVLATVSLLMSAAAVEAVPPRVDRVEPDQANNDAPADVSINGAAFDAAGSAALLAGGPRALGSAATPGRARRVVVDVDVAFVADEEAGLVVFDVSDPALPVEVSRVATPSRAVDVARAGRTIFIAYLDGFTILNASDPANLAFVGRFESTGRIRGLDHEPGTVYLALGGDGMATVDVSDLRSPKLLATAPTGGTAIDVSVADRIAHVVNERRGVTTLDVGDPASPTFLGQGAMPEGVGSSIVASNGFALVAAMEGGLQVFDATDPTRPARVGSAKTFGRASDVVFSDGIAMVADVDSGLVAVDVSDPREPVLGGVVSSEFGAEGVTAFKGRILVAMGERRALRLFDADSPFAPQAVVSFDTPGLAMDVDVQGELAAVADGSAGLILVDLGDGEEPESEGRLDTSGSARAVLLDGDRAFVADAGGGLLIADVSESGSPSELGRLELPSQTVSDVALDRGRNLALLALPALRGGLRVVDVASPTAPVEIGSYELTEGAERVAFAGGVAYLTMGERGLEIVDLADPAAPVQLANLPIPGRASDVQVVGNHAFVAARDEGVAVIDVTDPSAPSLVARTWVPGRALGIQAGRIDDDGLLFVATFDGLATVDVSDRSEPRLVGHVETPGFAEQAALLGEGVVVADDRAGLAIVRLNPPLENYAAVSGEDARVTVPRGYVPGPYDVYVANAEGESGTLDNGFRACLPRELDALLRPAVAAVESSGPGGGAPFDGIAWWLSLEGDESVLGPFSSADAEILLPALEEPVVVSREPGAVGGDAIEIHLDPSRGGRLVRLLGPSQEMLGEILNRAMALGGVSLSPLSSRAFAPVALQVESTPARNVPKWIEDTEDRETADLVRRARMRYRFEFEGADLVAARVRGPGADLAFRARARDQYRCALTAMTRFTEALLDVCEELAEDAGISREGCRHPDDPPGRDRVRVTRCRRGFACDETTSGEGEGRWSERAPAEGRGRSIEIRRR